MAESFQEIAIEALKESRNNPRKSFDAKFLKELEASIREKGVINPLIVRPNGTGPGHYEILAGANRFRAAKAAGLKAVPAIVREMDDRAAMELMLLDNLQRVGVHPLEEARGYKTLIAMGPDKTTAEDIATKIGKSAKYVWDRLKLLELAPAVERAFEEGAFELTSGHAILLARLETADQLEMLETIKEQYEGPVSVRELEQEIKWAAQRKKYEAEREAQRVKEKAACAADSSKKKSASGPTPAELKAKDDARRAAEDLKRKGERIARVATVKAILEKVSWPLPRRILEIFLDSPARAAKMKERELARVIVETLFGQYDHDYPWQKHQGAIERAAKIYSVKPVQVEKPATKKPASSKHKSLKKKKKAA